MGHNIHRNADGIDAMFVVGDREAAWHHLGQRAEKAVHWQDAMELARLNWTVSLEPVHFKSGKDFIEVPNKYAVVRNIDQAPLGVVGKFYEPIQNAQIFEFMDALMEADKGAHYESAGALGNGARIWAMARIPAADFTVGKNDRHEQYLLATGAHDGSEAIETKLTDTRVVCQNTLETALTGAGASLRIRHTQDGHRRMEEAKELLQGAVVDAQALKGKFETLAKRRMTKESLFRIADRMFPVETDPKKLEESAGLRAAITKRDKIMSQVIALYDANDGDAIPEIRGTAYNFLNAFTEWVDHTKEVTGRGNLSAVENRAQQAVFGTGAEFKSKALRAILEETDPDLVGVGAVRHNAKEAQDLIDDEVKRILGS